MRALLSGARFVFRVTISLACDVKPFTSLRVCKFWEGSSNHTPRPFAIQTYRIVCFRPYDTQRTSIVVVCTQNSFAARCNALFKESHPLNVRRKRKDRLNRSKEIASIEIKARKWNRFEWSSGRRVVEEEASWYVLCVCICVYIYVISFFAKIYDRHGMWSRVNEKFKTVKEFTNRLYLLETLRFIIFQN